MTFDFDNVEKPIVNGLRFLERLAGGEQLSLESNNPSVGGIAVRQAGKSDRLLLLLWHHEDPWWIDGEASIDLTATLPEGTAASGTTITRLDPRRREPRRRTPRSRINSRHTVRQSLDPAPRPRPA